MNNKKGAGLVKRNAAGAGVSGDFFEIARTFKIADHLLWAGLAVPSEVAKRNAPKRMQHATLELTHRYQRRRSRYKVNLTKAAGLWPRAQTTFQVPPALFRSDSNAALVRRDIFETSQACGE
ncbi:hypothetical protein AGR4C_pa70048 [Agrobacterium tumefaciens str. Kerr 14]|uniref:Uncharacterized protein n=1 Tax=Agrobacterium tumefaciens str. Kerr 14 TaxID=1183424 RepID=A0A1S7SCP0_AGRTU|nr:hypothetical protein [Agrobacterium tumefaciens]CUX66562.1 hypothetical protein AGR4C_pa70048 [Agrobacterium tumefaciens str. Kerr 14]